MRASISTILLGLAVLLAAPTPSVLAATGDRWERTYPISRRADLHVLTDDGTVRVQTWARRAAAIRVTTHGCARRDGKSTSVLFSARCGSRCGFRRSRT